MRNSRQREPRIHSTEISDFICNSTRPKSTNLEQKFKNSAIFQVHEILHYWKVNVADFAISNIIHSKRGCREV